MAEQESKNNSETRAAYGRATTRLREMHREDFDSLLAEEYASAGLTVRRRLTEAERAEREAAKEAERIAKAEAKKQAKIDALKAELAALTEDDEFSGLAASIESVITADEVVSA